MNKSQKIDAFVRTVRSQTHVNIGNIEIPIDIYDVFRQHDIELKFDSPGAVSETDDGMITITVEPSDDPRRMRFNAARMLGHYYLHHTKAQPFSDSPGADYESYNRQVHEANRFAAGLLIPDFAYDKYNTVDVIADTYQVTVEAVMNRGRQIGVISDRD